MSIYTDLGIRPIINANATLTRLGGSVMPPEVVEAMVEASHAFVDLHELQRAVGERLAKLTRNEAAYVSCGAASGLALAAAACMVGTDHEAAQKLPHEPGPKNEIIVQKLHRNAYDFAVRQTVATLKEVGSTDGTSDADFESAINECTAAVFWFQGAMNRPDELPLERMIAIAQERDVPVIVDGAAQLPPTENLWKWTEMGAALAIFSGGKDLRGPQSSGLVVGRRDLVEAVCQIGAPNHGFGRPMKVGKEEMAGLLKAVELYLEVDQEGRRSQDEETVAGWCHELNKLDGVQAERSFPNEAGQPLPRAKVAFNAAVTNADRDQVMERLLRGTPAVDVAPAGEDAIFLNPMTLADGEDEIVVQRLIEILQTARKETR